MRNPDDPGPDWWPIYSWKQWARWFLEGFLIPLGVYLIGWVGLSIYAFAVVEDASIERALATGGVWVGIGSMLTGGGITLSAFLDAGLRWKTFARVIGWGFAIIVVWNLSGLILDLAA